MLQSCEQTMFVDALLQVEWKEAVLKLTEDGFFLFICIIAVDR
jgi:hypothetical protein